MKHADDIDLVRVHALMMAALDNECGADDRRELDDCLAQRPDLLAEFERLQRVKGVTMTMEIARPPEEFWDGYRRSVLHRTERNVAWSLIAVGAAILGAAAIWRWIETWFAVELPWHLKAASGAVFVGFALLIVSVIRERWSLSRRDPYSKEVER